jgi:hypothetical protein
MFLAKECPNPSYFALILSFVDDYAIPRKRTTDAAFVMKICELIPSTAERKNRYALRTWASLLLPLAADKQ